MHLVEQRSQSATSNDRVMRSLAGSRLGADGENRTGAGGRWTGREEG